ncbi:MAG: PadR family transcriptional regulator [Thermomicrobiales bacterium]
MVVQDSDNGFSETAATGERAGAARELPAEHALLGLLLMSGGTAHGYDLARQFRRGQPLGEVIRLEPAMLYKHLKKLARLGWLTMTTEDQAPRPPRQICHLTPGGHAELRRWLAEPVARTREIRLEFLVKLYFAMNLEPELAQRLIRDQHVVVEQLAESLAEQLRELDTDASPTTGDDRLFHQLVLELRLEQTRAAADWLTQSARTLQTPQQSASNVAR